MSATGRVRVTGPALGRALGAGPLALCAVMALAACARGEPPAWDAAPGSYSVAPLAPPAPLASAVGFPRADGTPAARPNDSRAQGPTPAPSAAVPAAPSPPLAMPESGALPQTHDKPDTQNALFEARAAALFQAIVDDTPDRALPFFFPVAAYEQVKAITNPARDWKLRLVAAFTRDIHDLHLKLGRNTERAKLVRLDVPAARAVWVEPGEEYNKIGYYRVFGSKLRYEVDGHPRDIEVRSLISWRGEWFVVHLSGMK